MVGMLVGMTTTIINGACGIDIDAWSSTPPISMFLKCFTDFRIERSLLRMVGLISLRTCQVHGCLK